VASYITVEDFQYYWQGANEQISSSFIRLHMGHYKAVSFDPELSALHACKLSLTAKVGLPLNCWGKCITVLLENNCGNNFVHRPRVICLFEADFNWWITLLFAKQMMSDVAEQGVSPDELFAKKGSNAMLSMTSLGSVWIDTLRKSVILFSV